jgi:hypothetical protein
MRDIILGLLLTASLLSAADARGHGHFQSSNGRVYYGGGHHTYSHGGHYFGGVGPAHRHGHYLDARTGNRHGRHK